MKDTENKPSKTLTLPAGFKSRLPVTDIFKVSPVPKDTPRAKPSAAPAAIPAKEKTPAAPPTAKKYKINDRVWPSQVDPVMARIEYRYDVSGTCVFCHAFLDGKFHLETGSYATVSKSMFDETHAKETALARCTEAATKAVWKMEGYKLYQKIYSQKNQVKKG